jgi:mannose-1-phosphate guanylyltransferase/mannose-6-phosphate isomerase
VKVIPIILSGGSGTRLWPLSRASKPKQFLSFGTPHSLFQETLLRCRGALFDARPVIVGADAHRFLLAEDLLEIGVAADILLEPAARNSCAAVAAGCLAALQRDREAIVLVLAADHHIPDAQAFAAAVALAAPEAAAGRLVTFGIEPDRPATGYGYIRPGERLETAFGVEAFVEKPPAARAADYVAQGYLWNSGNFLFGAASFLAELKRLQPAILAAVEQAFGAARRDLDFIRLDAAFAGAPAISIDHAVMEKTDKAAVLPVAYAWSDVGSWDAVLDIAARDGAGNAAIGHAVIEAGSNNLVHSERRLTALLGVDDLVVVTTPDAVLVAGKARAEGVKELVAGLKAAGRAEAGEAQQIFRPWGNYERLDMAAGYQVKRITVKPGGVLSLQKHRHRAEHWVVVQGEAEVTIDGAVSSLKPNQSVYVPLGSVHRLANRGAAPVVLIEVQTGDYLGEDDIIRLEDSYNRIETSEPRTS